MIRLNYHRAQIKLHFNRVLGSKKKNVQDNQISFKCKNYLYLSADIRKFSFSILMQILFKSRNKNISPFYKEFFLSNDIYNATKYHH